MLSIHVANKKQDQSLEHSAGPLEFGRGPRREAERFKVEDNSVSRDQLRVEELPGSRIRVENLSLTTEVALADGSAIATQAGRELDLPVHLIVGQTRIEIELGALDAFDKQSLLTISPPLRSPDRARRMQSLHDLGDAPAPETLAHWLETVITLQRSGIGATQFHEQTAQALVSLVGLDQGLVLLRRDATWEVAAGQATDRSLGTHFSRTLLNHVVAERRTFYQNWGALTSPGNSDAARGPAPGPQLSVLSQQNYVESDAVVVSPIFGLNDDAVGALYGVRRGSSGASKGIRPLEAQVVQLLAAAVGANLARAAATRTRVQFEQFFSPELVRELERDATLLEGRDQEVTVLVSDLRGFSGLSERLGPHTTCRLLRDLMERLSERIVEQGGVIVDYAGDGILAMWNAPAVQEDHQARACRAALAMLDELPGLNARWQEVAGAPLALGIGLNTGPAQVGNTGSSRKFKYGPHGHTVNLASRVQDATKKLRLPLLITDATRDGLPEMFITRRLGQFRVAGISEAVCLHELPGETPAPDWLARRDAYESALALYESRQWTRACQALAALLELTERLDRLDQPTFKLIRRVWECLETQPESFDPVMPLEGK